MKIIYNSILPPKGYKAINLFGILFVRKDASPLREKDINHENIHTRQIVELLGILFYIWYGIEWVIRLIQYQDRKMAYYNISFEREAYANDNNLEYLKSRKLYSFLEYIFLPK